MSDLMNAIIAAKLMGNGGGGGGSGLPPIEKTAVELFNDTIAFAQGGSAYSGGALVDFSTVVGQQYVINWDGTPYTCTAVDIGSGFGVVGNLAILGAGEDTGEPFVGYAYEGTLVLMTASTAASHAVKIDGEIQSPPDGSALVVVGGEWTTQDGYGYTKNDPDYGPVVTKMAKKYAPSAIVEAQGESTISTVIRAGMVQMITAEIIAPPNVEGGVVMQFRIEEDTTPLIVQSGRVSGGNATLYVYNASSTDTSISTNDYVEMVIVQ